MCLFFIERVIQTRSMPHVSQKVDTSYSIIVFL